MSPTKPLVIGLGEVLWDLFPTGKQLGGAPANFAYHAHVVGAASAVVSAVGRDALGEQLLDRLRAVGLDVRHIAIDPQHATGSVTVELDGAGQPLYVIQKDAAWDFIPAGDEVMELATRADVVCFGSLAQRSPVSRQTIRRFLAQTPETCLRIFDINLRQQYFDEEVIGASLQLAKVLKLNDQELPIVAQLLKLPQSESSAIESLLEQFPLRLVALTRGQRGSSLYTRGQADHHGGFATATVDTVGAGDAFTAALAMGLLNDRSLPAINESANRLASYVCSVRGAMPVLPSHLQSQPLA